MKEQIKKRGDEEGKCERQRVRKNRRWEGGRKKRNNKLMVKLKRNSIYGGKKGLKRKPKSKTTLDSEALAIEHPFCSVIKGRTFKPIFHSQKIINSATGPGWSHQLTRLGFLTCTVSWTPLAVWWKLNPLLKAIILTYKIKDNSINGYKNIFNLSY